MFLNFFYNLREAGVPVSPTSLLTLHKALSKGLIADMSELRKPDAQEMPDMMEVLALDGGLTLTSGHKSLYPGGGGNGIPPYETLRCVTM